MRTKVTADLAKLEEVTHCHNCGAAVDYHYCALCGQETKLHIASAGEFFHEFIGHYVALEGKLWQTLRYLMLKPGFLTAEYIAGRRARYVQPLRVYLTLSLLFFAVLKLGGPPVVDLGNEAARPAGASAAVLNVGEPKAKSELEQAIVSKAPAMEAKINAFLAKPQREQARLLQNAFFSYVPYAMFLLMPLFAFYLKLLYLGSGRHYGEHMLFALHSNAFAFAMFAILILTGYLDLGLLSFGLTLWLLAWLPLGMRRVYGGARFLTFVRWLVLSLLHILSIVAAIVGAFAMAVAV